MQKKTTRFSSHLFKNRALSFPYIIILLLLVLFLLGNFIFKTHQTPLGQILTNLSHSPFYLNYHKTLLRFYQRSNNFERFNQAFYSYQSAKDLPQILKPLLGMHYNKDILGELSEYSDNLNQQKSYWQKVVANNPKIRDAWLQLAILSFNKGEKREAEIFMERVLTLDPNFLLLHPEFELLGKN